MPLIVEDDRNHARQAILKPVAFTFPAGHTRKIVQGGQEVSMRVVLRCALIATLAMPAMAQAQTGDVVVMRRTVAPPRPRASPTPTPTPAVSTCPKPARNLFPGDGDTGNYLAVISFSSSSEMQTKALEVCNGPLRRTGRTACLVAIFDTGTGAIVYTPVGTTKLNANSGTNGTTFWASMCS